MSRPSTTVDGKQTVTYKINPDAKWSDGQPITSTDFKYTWQQIVNGDDIYDKTGYTQIESIDDSEPEDRGGHVRDAVRVVEGQLRCVLRRDAEPHPRRARTRSAAMSDGYDWSGGPWIAKWDKGVQVTLTPNPNWYGTKAKLDKVIFKFQADTAAEFKAFKNGETKAIYPQPQLDAVQQIQDGIPGTNSFFTADTGNVESLWINNEKAPFTSVPVRQAFALRDRPQRDRQEAVRGARRGQGREHAQPADHLRRTRTPRPGPATS